MHDSVGKVLKCKQTGCVADSSPCGRPGALKELHEIVVKKVCGRPESVDTQNGTSASWLMWA